MLRHRLDLAGKDRGKDGRQELAWKDTLRRENSPKKKMFVYHKIGALPDGYRG